ncbi:DUF4886 domain-containing protein [Sphingobacterium hotanense]|uniref:DUF4886 domain-containing protein n=1 Tax=Sphingobacterium hotanense TaxID=649196 RepID=UPI0011F1B749|nr:DUF4886 domain-containing protein [Sphingobacterium hotanense]
MNKLFYKISQSLLIIMMMTVAFSCKKDGNPNKLPDADISPSLVAPTDGYIRILAIGNSFSEDAIESHLYELAKESGKTVIIGNLYIGGASLELHKRNIENNGAAYEYRKIGADGARKVFPKVSIQTALMDEHWDYISFQQVSQNSGQLQTIKDALPTVFNMVKEKALNPNVQYIYHQTWAYQQNSTHEGFANYDKDQMKMYEAIVDVSKQVKDVAPINIIIPAGTAIQNARTSLVGDNFTRDGYHLTIPFGRYIAACTWFETLFKKSAVGMAYKPDGLSAFESSIAQNAAHLAVLKPYEVTQMTDFQGGVGGPLTSAVLIDFGNNAASERWNQLSSFLAGTSASLKDSLGSYTGIKATITERFNSVNADGPTTTTTPLNMPANVSKYSYFGNSKADFGGMRIVQSKVELTGLDKDLKYNLSFFGARGNVSDNRETKYICKGLNEVSVALNTSSNSSNIAVAKDVQPDANGKITITITAGENNNNGTGFFYISALRLMSSN